MREGSELLVDSQAAGAEHAAAADLPVSCGWAGSVMSYCLTSPCKQFDRNRYSAMVGSRNEKTRPVARSISSTYSRMRDSSTVCSRTGDFGRQTGSTSEIDGSAGASVRLQVEPEERSVGADR